MHARVLSAPLNRPVVVSAAIHLVGFSILFAMRPNVPPRLLSPETSVTLEAVHQAIEQEAPGSQGSAGSSSRSALPAVATRSQETRSTSATPIESGDNAARSTGTTYGGVVGDVLGGGSGLGNGVGAGGRSGGSGSGLFNAPLPTSLKAPPPPSKARPARLIYPSRRRDVPSEQLFVVELHIDDRGYVTGVRLVRGQDPHSTEKALDAVWRFRYDPARDDGGNKVSSVLEQEFHLNR